MKTNHELNNRKVLENRVRLLVGARLTDRKKMAEAAKTQDSLAEKYKNHSNKWNSTELIRKLRER